MAKLFRLGNNTFKIIGNNINDIKDLITRECIPILKLNESIMVNEIINTGIDVYVVIEKIKVDHGFDIDEYRHIMTEYIADALPPC